MMPYKNKTNSKVLKTILIACSVLAATAITLFQSTTKAIAQTQKDDERIFTYVEQMPEFPGGMTALMTYLGNNIHYPPKAKKDNVQGKAVIRFVVKKDGTIGNVEIVRDLEDGCGAEAKRVVAAMPAWKPGKMNGGPVSVYYTLPVSFKLQSK
jgi:periplasmic protein TonB